MQRNDADIYGSRRRLVAAAAPPGRSRSLSAPRHKRSDNAIYEHPDSNMYQPGNPIGFFAAKGTVYQRKYFSKKMVCCLMFLGPPTVLISLAIMLFPVIGAIAEHALHTAAFDIQSSNITDPGNSSFPLSLRAHVSRTGLFPAELYFRQPVNVYWNTPPPDMREVHLGHFDMGMVKASGGVADVNQITTLHIDDEEAFGIFAGYLMTEPSFTWRINCTQVHAVAFSFLPVYKYLPIQKDIVIKGINNLEDLRLINVQLPGNDPAGGIQVSATALMTNPSPFGMQVGTLVLGLYYDDLYLGPVQAENVNLTSGHNILTLNGRMLPHNDNATALAQLGVLFTNYINSVPTIVIGKGVSATLSNGKTVNWLQQGITSLSTSIPFLPPEPINPITGIIIDYMSLAYDPNDPWSPILFSNSLDGKLALPFGFTMNITQLATEITLISNGGPVGTTTGPFAPAKLNITSQSVAGLTGDVALELLPSKLVLPNDTDAAKQHLIDFQTSIVYSSSAVFEAKGVARTITDTPVGRLLLDGIKFDVNTGLIGLNGLQTYPTIINKVDVIGGFSDALQLNVSLTMVNPSNLNLSVGDTTFNLAYENVTLGNATLADLIIMPGRNDYSTVSYFDSNRGPAGGAALDRFLSGQDTLLNIVGFNGSSKIASLAPSLAGIRLNATLPGMDKNLVGSANLTVNSATSGNNDVASSHRALNRRTHHKAASKDGNSISKISLKNDNSATTIVNLKNPFSTGMKITSIVGTASTHGIRVANINATVNFSAAGKATTASPPVPLVINMNPSDLLGLLRALAVDVGENPAYIDGLASVGGYTLTTSTSADGKNATKRDLSFSDEEDNILAHKLMGWGGDATFDDTDDDEDEESDGIAKRGQPLSYPSTLQKRKNLYTGFQLPPYVLKCFVGAKSDLVISSNAQIGNYSTTISFDQKDVSLNTDKSILKLLPAVALPIVQKIVDQSILNIDQVTLTDPKAKGFTATMNASITKAGPFDGIIEFPNGLDIYWNGKVLTHTAFPKVNLVGDVGSSINSELQGTIPDVDYFTQFMEAAILNDTFVWTVKGTGLSVSALGITVPNVTISKDVTLKGMNGLVGSVVIDSFDVPGNDPKGGLHLTAKTSIKNPSQVGIALSRFGTNLYDGDILLGPTDAAHAILLKAASINHVALVGRMIRQTTPAGLAALSDIFTKFVHGVNLTLTVKGNFAGPADVIWLNNGIKVISISVILPAQHFQTLKSISLNSMALYFTEQTAWSPRTDSSNTTAHFYLPFAMPINITSVSGPFTINYKNQDIGVLNIPASPAQTDVERRIMLLMFKNVALSVADNSHDAFSNFVADFTKGTKLTINLHGSATAITETAAGTLTISDIAFNLNTTLPGLQNLNAKPANISDLDVAHGYPTYLEITTKTTLFNPSTEIVGAGDLSFSVMFQNQVLGIAFLQNITLHPGENTVPTQIKYMPSGAAAIAAGQNMLQNYIQNVTTDAVVKGNDQTTKIPSLQKGLSGITLSTKIPPLDKLLVVGTTLVVPKNIAQTGVATAAVTISNTFSASINILQLHAEAIVAGVPIGSINQDLAVQNKIISSPGKKITTSQPVPININIDPKNLVKFIEAAAKVYKVDLGPLPPFFAEVLKMKSTNTTITPYPDVSTPPCHSGKAFDTLGAVSKLLAHMTSDIPINASVKLDDYASNLNFIQKNVPVKTGPDALYLVGPAAAPLIQLVVDQSILTVTQANATDLTNDGFTVSLLGSLKVDTPADAYIEFPDGVTVNFQGKDIATIMLEPLCTGAPDGIPVLRNKGQLKITDQAAFTEFTYILLTQPSFEWFLHTKTARARSLGIVFSNVILEKTVKLYGMAGLPGLVITDFSTPGDGPGKINIKASTPITSLSNLGVQLDYATFDIFFLGTNVGTITSEQSFVLPKATSVTVFNGYLRSQKDNAQGLAHLGIMFSQLLSGKNSTMSIRGVKVVTKANNMQPVSWLTAAITRFTDNVVLPGHLYQVLFSIQLSDLTVTVENITNPYTILTSNKHTVSTYANPFTFHLQPLSVAPQLTLTYLGQDAGQLNLPSTAVTAGVSTGPKDIQNIEFGFQNQFITGINHNAFSAFFAKLADSPGAVFGLRGSTTVVAATQIGNTVITGVPINISTSFPGLNSFGHATTLHNVEINNPTPDYIGVNLLTTLNNPSNMTLHTKSISLPSYFATTNTLVGRAVLPELDLVPGPNLVTTQFHLMIPDNSSAVQEMLSLYLQPKDLTTSGLYNTIPLAIKGSMDANPPMTPYACLEESMAGITMTSSLQGLATRMVKEVRVYIPLDIVAQELRSLLHIAPNGTNLYSYSYLDAVNQLPTEVDFVQLSTTAYSATNPSAGQYARFTQDFNSSFSYTLPAGNKGGQPSVPFTTSPELRNVLLSKGLISSLPLVGHNVNTDNYVQIRVRGPNGTYLIPGLHYQENNVTTKYFLSLKGTGDHGIDIGGPINSLTELVHKIIGGGGGSALSDKLGDSAHGFGSIPGVGPVICGLTASSCKSENSTATTPAAASQSTSPSSNLSNTTSNSASNSSSPSSSDDTAGKSSSGGALSGLLGGGSSKSDTSSSPSTPDDSAAAAQPSTSAASSGGFLNKLKSVV